MKKLFKELYNQLEPDSFEKVAISKNGLTRMQLVDFGHRIPGVLIISHDGALFGFSKLLKFAGMIIDDEPEETICCDTDMDSYKVTIIHDLEHGYYPVPENKLWHTEDDTYTQINLPPHPNGFPTTAIIIEPDDYHS